MEESIINGEFLMQLPFYLLPLSGAVREYRRSKRRWFYTGIFIEFSDLGMGMKLRIEIVFVELINFQNKVARLVTDR